MAPTLPSSPAPRVPALLLTGLAVWLGAASLAAQSGLSGSASTWSTARELPSAGGTASSASYRIRSTVAAPAAGSGMVSATYRFEGGVVGTPSAIHRTGPIVFGVEGGRGPKEGGSTATVRGLGFQAPGAGALQVTFAGTPAATVQVVSDTELRVTTPPGTDPFGNTLGLVDVRVTHALGAATAPQSFAFTPTLQRFTPARLGNLVALQFLDAAGNSQALSIGFGIPGQALRLPPLTGAFGLLVLSLPAADSALATDDTTTWTLPLPADPALAGQTVELQAISITSFAPVVGSFSNVHPLQLAR